MESPPPQYLALKAKYNGKYLRYLDEGKSRGGLQCSADQVVSPFTKFVLETAKNGQNFVHIKCCYNNKYWVTFSRLLKSIQPLADEPEEDQSKWSCTLFELLYDADLQAYRIRHVKLGFYLIPDTSHFTGDDTIYAGTDTPDSDHLDVFIATDFRSLFVLPKHVAFKGDNGRYLCATIQEDHEYLEFSGANIGDDKAAHEVFMNNDGSIRIMSKFFGKFWRLSPNWIWADSSDASSDNLDTCFWPFKYSEDNTTALKNLGNNLFCKRLTVDGKTDCLNASATNMGSSETKLIVEELINSREIYNIEFRFPEAKIYHETIDTKDYVNLENNGSGEMQEEISLSFKDIVTGTFSTTLSLKLGIKTTIETKAIPYILENKIELSAEFSGSFTWGKTRTFEREVKHTLKFPIPSKKKVKARLIATKGSCDVPFSYTQRDTLLDGQVVVTTIHDGMFYGANSYNVHGRVDEI